MPLSEVTNPAQRARLFVEQFNSAIGTGGHSVRNVFATLYDVEPSDNSSLMRVLSDAWKLPGQIRVDLKRSGLDPDDYEDALRDLEMFLNQLNIDSHSQTVKNNTPPGLMSSLRMISGMLNKDLPEVAFSDSYVEKVLGMINDLESEVLKGNFDSEFSDFIMHNISRIRYAVLHYDTLGQDELISRVDQMFGGVIRNYSLLTNGKTKTDLVHRLLAIGASILFTIGAFNSAIELHQNISNFIGQNVIKDAEILIDLPTDLKTPSDRII